MRNATTTYEEKFWNMCRNMDPQTVRALKQPEMPPEMRDVPLYRAAHAAWLHLRRTERDSARRG